MPHIESVLLRSSSDFNQTVKNRSIVMFRNQKMVWQKTQQIIDPCLPPTFIYFILSESDHRWTAINLPILHRTTAWQLRTVRTFLPNIWTLLPPFYTAIFSINIMSTFSWSPQQYSTSHGVSSQAPARPQWWCWQWWTRSGRAEQDRDLHTVTMLPAFPTTTQHPASCMFYNVNVIGTCQVISTYLYIFP